MNHSVHNQFYYVGLMLTAAVFGNPLQAEETQRVTFEKFPGKLRIQIGNQPFADYIYHDEKILRPHFAHVHAPGGIQATRHHPPRVGKDSTDHATMHPGIWLAFGDISGADFWRNRAHIEHVRFVEPPHSIDGAGSFTVMNRYISDGKTICTEVCQHRIIIRPAGYLLTYESKFTGEREFYFGDQEELGLGLRVRSELRVKGGNGRILNSDGGIDEQHVWGKQADWCDYSGPIGARRVGFLLMPSPHNFRRSWFHARDYGFMAANPFGRNAFTRGEKSRVVVEPGETFRLGYGLWIYSVPKQEPIDPETIFRDYTNLLDPEK